MNYALFRKPSRYIGNEINMLRKDGNITVALCFPDSYEIGMSHMGLRILYSIINSVPHAAADRVYAPWVDLESYLRSRKLPLRSVEHQRPLKDFDIVGFTLQYELSYTNVLNMMDLGGIPVRSAERGQEDPIVIAGGPCAVNPLPLSPFIDAFIIGDGEDVIREVIDTYSAHKAGGNRVRNKEGVLNALADLEGVYVPSVHDVQKKTVRRRVVEDLDKAPFPDAPVLPYTEIVHDRVAIEISRGCTKGCRFCQAGMIYRPLRERSPDRVLSLALRSIAATGYEEISFTSLSTGDYRGLVPLIRDFNRHCAGSNISVSLPSLRVGAIHRDVLKAIKSVRKTGFTIAPEAGTKRLRNVINKDFSDEEFDETLHKLFTEGWSSLKLYFMIGLPTETMSDIDGLIDMAIKASQKGRQLAGKRVNINTGISAFIPKPHTPFQWEGQCSLDELRNKQDYIRRAFKKRGINFKGQHVENSLLEAVFARGDRGTALLLENAWKGGCHFDGWTEMFNFSKWELAAQQTGTDLFEYASRSLDCDSELPWDFVDTGITKEFLKEEYGKAIGETITPDCNKACCGCGLECREKKTDPADAAGTAEVSQSSVSRGSGKFPVSGKVRAGFSKTGVLKYLSHQEVINAILRALRRAEIPLSYSTGFHPHPRISFGPALPCGVEGLKEYFDIDTSSFVPSKDFMSRLNARLPQGLAVHSAVPVSSSARALNDQISRYEYELIIDKSSTEHIHSFMARQTWPVARDTKKVDIRPMVEKADIHEDTLNLVLADTDKVKVRLYEILKELLHKSDEEVLSIPIKRTGLGSKEEAAGTLYRTK